MNGSLRQENRPAPRTDPRLLQRLIPRLKMARVLSMPEENFGQMVLSVEKSPMFRKFFHTDDLRRKVFSYRRYPNGGLVTGFLELKDELTSAGTDVDIESLLAEKRDLIELCRRIGRRNFETYFLNGEEGHSLESIGRACGLTSEDAQRLMDLTTHIGVHAEFYEAPAAPEQRTVYSRIAHIERDGDEFFTRYTSLRYGRGRYVIDYKKLDTLKSDIPAEEFRALKQMTKTMELVNARRSTVHQILEAVMVRQRAFLMSGRDEDLQDLTQDDLARRLSVHPSTICRAVAAKSIVTPWNQERPLRDFLGRGSLHGILAEMDRLVEEEDALRRAGKLAAPYRDDQIRDLLKQRRGWTLAVRTISKYRSLAGIPNLYQRALDISKK